MGEQHSENQWRMPLKWALAGRLRALQGFGSANAWRRWAAALRSRPLAAWTSWNRSLLRDERSATIERLEAALAEERERSESLMTTIRNLDFKLDVLEKGYAKQLEEARARQLAAERDAAELNERLALLESGESESARVLAEARAELDRPVPDAKRLRRLLSLSRAEGDSAHEGVTWDAETINELLTTTEWADEARSAPSFADSNAAVEADPDTAADLLPPELVFPGKDAAERG